MDQLDATRDGLIKLRDTRVAVNHIREEMVNVERLCEDPKTAIEGFSKISEVRKSHPLVFRPSHADSRVVGRRSQESIGSLCGPSTW